MNRIAFGRALAMASVTAVAVATVPLVGALAAPTTEGVQGALQLNGSSQYVAFGNNASLGLPQFTIETWFRRDGTGLYTSTSGAGGGGFDATATDGIVPLVAKGRGQADGSNLDMNYILGIHASGKIAADFEDTAATNNNHKLIGTTTLVNGTWYHAAASFDGTNWRLYLNGNLEASSTSTRPPRSDSIQHASLGSALTSTGVAEGFFNGLIDESRIWNYARTPGELAGAMSQPVISASGLVGRWGLDEGFGTKANNSVLDAIDGTLTGTPVWVDGYNLGAPAAGNYGIEFNGTDSRVSSPDGASTDASQFTVEAWIRRAATGGTAVTTGTNGVLLAYPIVTNGIAEAETAAADINYFVGIDSATGVLVADFEEAASGASPGLNHPIYGVRQIPAGEWHHVAATYDGTTWKLFVDGTPEATLTVGRPANTANTSPVGIGRGLSSTGAITTNSGSFAGLVDEVRIWSSARSAVDVAATYDDELTSGASLEFRLGMNEGTGIALGDSAGADDNGSLTRGVWTSGFAVGPPLPPLPTQPALDFNGSNQYVTFDDPASLDLPQFTIETWVRRDGAGTPTSTGTGGIPAALPLVTHGAPQADGSNVDMNWFLGLNSTGQVVADFEDFRASNNNHPVIGTNPVTNGVWNHVAATFDGTEWRLYLNGQLEAVEDTGGQLPRSDTTQRAALGTALTSTGATNGFFDGAIDEVRVWNYARSGVQINDKLDEEVSAAPGLVARWGLNDGAGVTVLDSVGTAHGTRTNAPLWVEGSPFVVPNRAPAEATVVTPNNGATGVGTSPTLSVDAADPDGDPLEVRFFGRVANAGAPAPDPFTIVALPDTQYYSESYPATFANQTQWIVDNRTALNIPFVAHLGDIVDDIDTIPGEWNNADAAMDILDASGVPYAIPPGNHDITTAGVGAGYDSWFSPGRFVGDSWYGGYLGDSLSGGSFGITPDAIDDAGVDRKNMDSYQLFNVGSLKFMAIALEYDMPPATVAWAQRLIDAHPDREVILISHAFVNTSNARPTSPIYRADGLSAQQVWDQLVYNNCEVFMVLNGHYPGEGKRRDLNSCGQPVHQLLSDYQSRANGGNGWLRYMTFRPVDNEIDVKTYSTTLGQLETDADSQFTIDYDMTSAGAPFDQLGSVNVNSGQTASIDWAGRSNDTQYEWYAKVIDGNGLSSTSSVWNFTTQSANLPPSVVSVGVTPLLPRTNDSLSVSVSASDPDGTTPSLSYQWQIDTGAGWTPLVGETGSMLDLSAVDNGDRGDQLRVVVTASDGSLQDMATSDAVTVVNSAPVADDDTASTPKRTAVVVDVLAGDTDADGDVLSVGSVAVAPVGAGSAQVVASGLDAGKVQFTPANTFDGEAVLTYVVSDGTDTDTGTLTVTVSADTTPPGAVTGVTATAVAGGVKVGWSLSGASDVVSYDVLRGPAGCTDALCASVVNLIPISHPVVTFTDTTAVPGVSYVYFVRATDDSGNDSDLSAPASITYDCVSSQWRAEYFDGQSLSGPVVATQCVSSIDYNFGSSAPPAAVSVGPDTYSIRFTQVTDLAAGSYLFGATSDDGVRVKVDGDYVINDWTPHPATAFTGSKTLTAGEHTIVVEYFQGGGGAVIHANYTTGCAANQWRAEYFDGRSLGGSVVATECVSSIDYNFGSSAPPAAPGVGSSEYSIRFTQVTDLAAGSYLFGATSDDGVRVKVDGDYVINDWTPHPATAFTGSKTLTAGEHTIVVEYFQGGGGAVIHANYTTGCAANQWRAEYFDGRSLGGSVVATECVSSIDYNFGSSAPPAAPGVGSSEYSIRFTQVTDLAAGSYLFGATSDDGVRVKVDGDYVINDWTPHPATAFTGSKTLTAGEHTIVVEYFQGGGGAVIHANYTTGCAANQWRAEYFDGRSLGGSVVATECVSSIDYNFGSSAPPAAPGVGSSEYSIRFTQVTDLAAGSYLFGATSDDGVRVKVDGDYVINDWTPHPATAFTGSKTLTAGEHTIVVEYFQGGGGAVIHANYGAG